MNFSSLAHKQRKIAGKIKIKPFDKKIKTVAGIDVSFIEEKGLAVICVLSFPDLKEIETVYVSGKPKIPYISGFLAFREGPIIEKAFKKLLLKPDILIFDGQGIAHPRKCGIASHMGVLLNMPSIGAAKSRLTGNYKEPAFKKFSKTILIDNHSRKIGIVLRTKEKANPIFISPGHLTDFDSAENIIKKCLNGYRLPEPTRLAHIKSKLLLKSLKM